MPGWKRSSKKSSYKKKSSWKKKKTPRGYRRKAVHYRAKPRRSMKTKFAAKRRVVGAKKKPTVKAQDIRAVDPAVAGVAAGYGKSANGVGSWNRARGSQPFADRFFCRDVWDQTFVNYDFTVPGVYGQFTFRANSVFDPIWVASTGQTSAKWFPLVGEVYLQYRVHASSIKVRVDPGHVSNDVLILGLWPSLLAPSSPNGPNTLAEMKLMPNVKLMQFCGSTVDVLHDKALSHYMKMGDLAGVPCIADDLNFSGLTSNSRFSQVGTNPNLTIFWSMAAFFADSPSNRPSASQGITFNVSMKFDVEYFNLVPFDGQAPAVVEDFEHMKI